MNLSLVLNLGLEYICGSMKKINVLVKSDKVQNAATGSNKHVFPDKK